MEGKRKPEVLWPCLPLPFLCSLVWNGSYSHLPSPPLPLSIPFCKQAFLTHWHCSCVSQHGSNPTSRCSLQGSVWTSSLSIFSFINLMQPYGFWLCWCLLNWIHHPPNLSWTSELHTKVPIRHPYLEVEWASQSQCVQNQTHDFYHHPHTQSCSSCSPPHLRVSQKLGIILDVSLHVIPHLSALPPSWICPFLTICIATILPQATILQ